MRQADSLQEIAFFPGCSLATSSKENYESLDYFCQKIGYKLVEVPDWSCCGTSSAHSIDAKVALELPSRNLALAPKQGTLLVACPSCYMRLVQTYDLLLRDEDKRRQFERRWDTSLPQELQITPFLSFLAQVDMQPFFSQSGSPLNGMLFAPYYGCMLVSPASMPSYTPVGRVMEDTLSRLGATPCNWTYATKCCGTFLSAARPDIITPRINAMMQGAVAAGAECIVTACAMCHFNLEMRATRREGIPVFHFSELLSIAAGAEGNYNWYKRHLIDPLPLLREKELIK